MRQRSARHRVYSRVYGLREDRPSGRATIQGGFAFRIVGDLAEVMQLLANFLRPVAAGMGKERKVGTGFLRLYLPGRMRATALPPDTGLRWCPTPGSHNCRVSLYTRLMIAGVQPGVHEVGRETRKVENQADSRRW